MRRLSLLPASPRACLRACLPQNNVVHQQALKLLPHNCHKWHPPPAVCAGTNAGAREARVALIGEVCPHSSSGVRKGGCKRRLEAHGTWGVEFFADLFAQHAQVSTLTHRLLPGPLTLHPQVAESGEGTLPLPLPCLPHL